MSERSAERWRRAWRERGQAGVLSQGSSPGRSLLSETLVTRLERELERGPLVHGWADQRWTLAWVKTLIGRLFHVACTLRGVSYLLHRIGYTPQVPAHRAAERDEDAIVKWRAGTWARVRG